MASLIKNRRTTLERIDKFISPVYFTDVNLYGKLYGAGDKLSLRHYAVPEGARISFQKAIGDGNFLPTDIGAQFGPTWSTHWFFALGVTGRCKTIWVPAGVYEECVAPQKDRCRLVLQLITAGLGVLFSSLTFENIKFEFALKTLKIEGTIPKGWLGQEVHLRWNAGCEGLIWSPDGMPLQGLSGEERSSFVLTQCATAEEIQIMLYLEMACNDLFGAGSPTMISPPDANKTYQLTLAEIATFDRQVYNLLIDLELMLDLAKELPETNPRSFDALYAANNIVNIIQMQGSSGYEEACAKSAEFFSWKNGETQHQNVAVGHCHIDSAWLWPYAETVRKCARSWASAIGLMRHRPDFTFVCSQAQQYEWVKESYPKLYEKLKHYVAKGQFIPVGGTWVEMDGNLPSGESFVRQFLYGQQFFQAEFGVTCREFWLPDTFGYSAQLPQIMRMFKIERFLTQKMSWSLVNKFPHHNFIWEGLDGSDVITHFPPGDSYGMEIKVREVVKQLTNLQDKGRVSKSLMLFGYGDGGGGPTESMLIRQLRLQNVDGLPMVTMGKPDELFEHLESNREKLCCWVGELYLELHNATYTTQATIKRLNRTCEFLLRDVEALMCALMVSGSQRIPDPENVRSLWKILLLNQFHDVLPGTSIHEVNVEAKAMLNDVEHQATKMICDMVRQNFGYSDLEDIILLNTLSWERQAVVQVPWSHNKITEKFGNRSILLQSIPDGSGLLVPICIPPICLRPLADFSRPKSRVTAEKLSNGLIEIKNQYLSVLLDYQGNVVSLKLVLQDDEFVSPGQVCNRLVLFDDIPLYWDAWDVMDYHLETKRPATTQLLEVAHIVENGPLRATVRCKSEIGEKSRVTQEIFMDAFQPYLSVRNEIEWAESHKFLKVEFPVSVRSPEATYEIQFGHIKRQTHFNTSWDSAKFEVCGHKWVDLSEHGRGIALLNDCKYGHSVHANVMSLSLLRSPKSPDAQADMETHRFSYAIMPHSGGFQDAEVIRRSYEFNSPLMQYTEGNSVMSQAIGDVATRLGSSWFQVSHPGIVLETIKPAEKGDCRYVLRLYEAFGGRCHTSLSCLWNVRQVALCNGFEEPLVDLEWKDGAVSLTFNPFQVLSLMLLVTDKEDCSNLKWH